MSLNSINQWKPGDCVVLRGIWRGKIWWACPATIVLDTPNLVGFYWRAGTPNMKPSRRPSPQELLTNQFTLVPGTWLDTDVLMLFVPGAAHSVNVMWEAGQRQLRCWYVDLLEPLRRTRIGFDSMDHTLDIVISADQSHWHWKDEDELDEEVALGVYSPEEAQAIRAEGERVLGIFKAGGPPFCESWDRWSPPPGWELPGLPVGWDEINNLHKEDNMQD